MEIVVVGTFARPKIIPDMTKLAIAQITVNYRLAVDGRVVGKIKTAGTKVTASLETYDGPLTAADFQEITDRFYSYFQKKLQQSGIDTTAWNEVTATGFYQQGEKKSIQPADFSTDSRVTSCANNGNILFGGGAGFAPGKVRDAAASSDQLHAPVACFHLTLDFAEILVGVNIRHGTGNFQIPKTPAFTYNSEVRAKMRVVQDTPGLSVFFYGKNSEALYLNAPIESDFSYIDAITQDPSRMKNNAFRFTGDMVPVVIETTRERYKEGAGKALERYADAFIGLTRKTPR